MDIFRDGIRVCPLGLLCFCLCSCVFCLGFWFAARLRNRPPPSLHPFKLLSNWNRPPTLITIQAKPARLHITNLVFDLMTEELPPFVKNTQLIHFSHVWCGVKSAQGFDRRANTHGQLFWRVRPKKKVFCRRSFLLSSRGLAPDAAQQISKFYISQLGFKLKNMGGLKAEFS